MRARSYRTAAGAAVAAVLALLAASSAFAVTITTFTPTTDFVPEEANNCVGTQIQINGTGFVNDGGTPSVMFNGTPAVDVAVGSDIVLYARVPAGATPGNITITTPRGTATSATAYNITPCASHGGPANLGPVAAATPAKAVVTGFKPAKGKTGTTVTISGKNLSGATAVRIGTTKVHFTAVSATKITATVSAAVKTGRVSVTVPSGTIVTKASFVKL
jgi:IPT/TIG domain-containing protein